MPQKRGEITKAEAQKVMISCLFLFLHGKWKMASSAGSVWMCLVILSKSIPCVRFQMSSCSQDTVWKVLEKTAKIQICPPNKTLPPKRSKRIPSEQRTLKYSLYHCSERLWKFSKCTVYHLSFFFFFTIYEHMCFLWYSQHACVTRFKFNFLQLLHNMHGKKMI